MGELVGRVIGLALAPLVFLAALVRRARAFHPDGVVWRADVVATFRGDGPLARVAQRLAGPALARLSPAMHRAGGGERDVLGLGVRFGAAGEQDLLLATFDGFQPAQLRRAMQETDAHDYLHNEYRAVSPYRVDGSGVVVMLRARGDGDPPRNDGPPRDDGPKRDERLARAVAAGRALLHVEARAAEDAQASWLPLVDVALVTRSSVTQAALRLSPLRDGLGLRGAGIYAGIRWAVYPVSQLARRLRGG
ncbi:MAG: hypothetical protein ACXVDD_05445 [Polyangia bacterium]